MSPRFRRPALAAGVALVSLAAACGGAPAATSPSSTPARAPAPSTTTTAVPSVAVEVGPGSRAVYPVEPQKAPGTCRYSWVGSDPLPDPACTPGAVNPDVTQADIDTTICRPGWTATVRPPERVTEPEKVGSAAAYGYTGSFATAEYDHLVPLELGGDPNDPTNLWVEPNDDPDATSTHNAKDDLEDLLRSLVCAGGLPLAVAQRAIASNWVAAASRYGS